MLYDKYVDKIKKVAKAKGVVLFFKFIFLAVFLVALVYSITFIANKGKLKDGIEMPSSINYGEDYEFSAKTQYGGDVRYFEYRAENSDEWSKAKPTLAGTYYVRAVSNKFIGSRKSSEYKFVINKQKLDINVSSTTITYGDYPNYSADGLKNKDVVNSLTFTFDSYGKTMTNVSISDVIVTDVNGEDVTNCYNITANGKEIGFDKKEVTFSPTMEDEFVYTGEEVTYGNTFTITNNLGYKDMAIVEGVICDKDGNVTNAILPGDYYVKINTYKVSNESEEVTCNYEVSTSKHYFSIVKRDIIIKTDSKSKTYDGTPLTCETYGVSDKTIYGLLDGDKLVNNSIGDYQSITYYEENGVENTMNIRIYDSLDNDVTDVFYNVSYDFGTLSIVKRNLVIKTSSDDTFIYDSNKHYRAELSDVSIVSGSLVDGEELYLLDMEYQPYIDMPGIKSNELKYSIQNSHNPNDSSSERTGNDLELSSTSFLIKPAGATVCWGLYKNDGNQYAYTHRVTNVAMAIGTNFRINTTGIVTMSGANISGKLTASQIEGDGTLEEYTRTVEDSDCLSTSIIGFFTDS